MDARTRLTALILVVLAFAAWALWLTWDVRDQRQWVATQVGWQIDIASARQDPLDAVSRQVIAEILPEIRDRFAYEQDVLATVTDLERALERGDAPVAASSMDALTSTIRFANGSISASLAQRWDQVTIVMFLSLGFAFYVVMLTAQRQKDQTELASTAQALAATKDRMARVGVGLLGLSEDNAVVFANEVAEGLAASARSTQDWWLAVMKGSERPGSVQCATCGMSTTVGRVDVEDHTGMGVRILEVVYGGHAHDLREPHHDVVLVRDVTDQRRKQVLTVLEERMSNVEELASGLAAQVEAPLKGVLRHLSEASVAVTGEAAAIVKKAQFEAILLRDAVVGFRVMGTMSHAGTADASIACRHAVQLVQHRLGRRTGLVTRHEDNLTVQVDGAALTQIVFSLLSDAVEACRDDRGRHNITLTSKAEGSEVWIEIIDDRDPRTSPTDVVARTVARERVDAIGATLELFRSGRKHTTRIQLPMLLG